MLSINCKGQILTFTGPVVMGIINATPDSFYPGSRQQAVKNVLKKAQQMIEDGAAIIDIGGQSTRPGSARIPVSEEYERVIPAIQAIAKSFPAVLISIDTFYATVAKGAVEAGASLVNDVSAGTIDPELIPAVAQLKVPYVLMHMQGDPQTMQQKPTYKNVATDVFDFLAFKIRDLHHAGIIDIIVDPGFGFGKTIEHNFQLLNNLRYFKELQKPILAGISRKGTVYRTLNITADEALNGTTVLNTVSLLNGAHILRVHDVKEAVQAIKLVAALQK